MHFISCVVDLKHCKMYRTDWFFSARRYASAVYAIACVSLSVCLPVGHESSRNQCRTAAIESLVLWCQRSL